MTDERRTVELERIHEREDEALAIGERMIRRILGVAKTRQVGRDDAQPVGGERREVARPDIGRGAKRCAVEEQHCGALALLEAAHPEPVDAQRALVHLRSATSSSTPSTSAMR